MKLPFVSRAQYERVWEYMERLEERVHHYAGQCDDLRTDLRAERNRYEYLVHRVVADQAAATMPPNPEPEPEPLPELIEDALTALRLTGAERAVEAAAAREMLRQRLPVEDVVATLWRGGPSEAGVTFEH